MKKYMLTAIAMAAGLLAQAQTQTWRHTDWEAGLSRRGTLEYIAFKGKKGNDTIPFFTHGDNAGPSFYANMGEKDEKAEWIADDDRSFHATIHDIECQITYKVWNNQPAIAITLKNNGHVPFQPVKAGIRLGIDTYMDKYPDWFGKYFPTLMMNEKSHFYGYMQTPAGHTLGIVSPDAIASWSVNYNLGYQDPPPHWFMGHRIESINLDLLNTLPLPSHCPQDMYMLRQGECKTWTIAFVDIDTLSLFEETLHKVADIPMLKIDRTSYEKGETATFDVLADAPTVTITSPSGKTLKAKNTTKKDDKISYSFELPEEGLYDITATDGTKQVHGVLTAHATWQQTMENAREAAWKHKQKATSHIESWYGFHSSFLAAKYFPSAHIDSKLSNRFDYLFNLLHDTEKMEPKYHASRIQNTSGTIGLLVDKYEAYGDRADIRKASQLADWLISHWQRKDGAYVNHNIVYTSVIYVAKSILELAIVERELGKTDTSWNDAFKRHYASAKRAIDQLVAAQGNYETEGEITFEDGMLSCSALQIGMLALMETDSAAKAHYTEAMLQTLTSHDCLTQLRVPDARRRGGTMRYWEAQYDVQMLPNMFNSPHGWSAWRAYATYYAYLLTGDEQWLLQTYNAVGAFSNLIDYKTGYLRWAFVVDPYLKVKQACSADKYYTADSLSFGNPHPELYDTKTFTIGEQYVNMISDWQGVNTQDNDVHEVFKCIGEAMLTNAFVIEREDGTVVGYNCTVEKRGGKITVTPSEKQITHLHCNLRHAFQVTFGSEQRKLPKGYLGWAFGGDIYAQ